MPKTMNHVERFRALMDFQPVDRLPRWEWAMWWDETVARWHGEGLPSALTDIFEISEYFGLDPYKQFWFSTTDPTIEATQHHVEGIVSNMDDYLRLRPSLFPDHSRAIAGMAAWAQRQAAGEAVVWTTLEGYFWFPRTLMGFEKLMYAYYDQPELIHQMNQDLLDFNMKLLDAMAKTCIPTFSTIAEDMSYNNGPMVSRGICDEFLAPYYQPMLALRKQFPKLRMVGHYNKMVMTHGEAAMREEFERLVPLMKAGGFIPSVDHQTPPGVSLEQYRIFRKLLDDYTTIGA